ncbi:hypothetical protein [Amycolatopsis anabasis]|uniref:hypothetical protein n=1 Tax=Amycolatopsis anabasis TaxID=1840409 RepID=UPI00131B8A06|nr:hypothetical protein [Amycolatopsis anabasis]
MRRTAAPGGATGSSRALKVAGAVVANTTLLTALLFFFGYLYTQVFFRHFRVHYTILGQPVDEILARGVDGLFVPLAVLAGVSLVLLCVARFLKTVLRPRTWRAVLRVCTPVAAIAGTTFIGLAVGVMIAPAGFREYAGVPGLLFATGVLLDFFAWRRFLAGRGVREPNSGVAEWGIVYLLMSVGFFWAVSDYSSAVGTRRAFEVEARVPDLPAVQVYSAKSLNLTASGEVRQVACREAEAAYRYRYDGLKLLLQSGGQYVLVPATWTSSNGTTIVLPRTDAVRLEFTPAQAVASGEC